MPLTANFDAQSGGYTKSVFASSSKTPRYTVGLTGTVYLPHRLGIEVDAQYRRLNYDWFNVSYPSANDAGVISTWTAAAGNRLDIPVMLKWAPARWLYTVGGFADAVHFGFNERSHTVADLVLAGHSDRTTDTSTPFAQRWSTGVTFGVGIDAPAGGLHIRPEVRYTHWISPAFDTYVFLAPATEQVDLLVGFEFGGRR